MQKRPRYQFSFHLFQSFMYNKIKDVFIFDQHEPLNQYASEQGDDGIQCTLVTSDSLPAKELENHYPLWFLPLHTSMDLRAIQKMVL